LHSDTSNQRNYYKRTAVAAEINDNNNIEQIDEITDEDAGNWSS
jgi:hypothetical protein